MNRLEQLRRQEGYTQKTIAKLLDISERSYRRIESGKTKPSCTVIVKLQNQFDQRIDYLLEQVTDPS